MLSTILSKSGRPVALFSWILTQSEQRHLAIDKEVYAIVEALWKWPRYLLTKYFRLVTDKWFVLFMFDLSNKTNIKNNKILRWLLELIFFNNDVIYRPEKPTILTWGC